MAEKPSLWYRLFSKIPALKHWLDNRAVKLELQNLDKQHRELEAKAKDPNEREQLEASWSNARDIIVDPIESENSERLVAQARKYHILVPRISQESEDWHRSQTMGGWILRKDAEEQLRREIRDQRRASVTFTFGVLAFILALVSLLIKTKQPDPCPHNYYRNDSDACVFALAPKSQAAPETPLPEKHSDKPKRQKPVSKPKN